MFVGREAELKTLEDLYGRDSWQMIVLIFIIKIKRLEGRFGSFFSFG